jgi:hypothetical protein
MFSVRRGAAEASTEYTSPAGQAKFIRHIVQDYTFFHLFVQDVFHIDHRLGLILETWPCQGEGTQPPFLPLSLSQVV